MSYGKSPETLRFLVMCGHHAGQGKLQKKPKLERHFVVDSPILVGGFNPCEKYQSNWKSSPNTSENRQYLKPPTSIPSGGYSWMYPDPNVGPLWQIPFLSPISRRYLWVTKIPKNPIREHNQYHEYQAHY